MTTSEVIKADRMTLAASGYVTSLELPYELRHRVWSTLRDLVVDGDAPFWSRVERERGGMYRIVADDRVYSEEVSPERVPDTIVWMLLLAQLDGEPDRLHLHSAAVAHGGAGILIAGTSGSGKSTLTTAAVRAGFDYLTDELVAIDPVSLRATGFSKPLSLVGHSHELFAEFDPRQTGHGQATDSEWQVPASSIGAGRMLAEMPISAVVFVRHDHDAEVAIEPVHPITAVRRLLHGSPDIARFGPAALEVCARVCTAVPCVELTYSRLADAEPALHDVLGLAAPSAVEFEFICGTEQTPGAQWLVLDDEAITPEPITDDMVLKLHDAVSLLVIGGRSLGHVIQPDQRLEPGNHLAEFAEFATAWLGLVDGESTVGELIAAVHAETGSDRSRVRAVAHQLFGDLAGRHLVQPV
jgi:hypothetical protein